MSTPVTYNGNSYNVPAYQDTGYAQGTGNLSSYLIALATGSLTLAGGNFPITSDVNFGASFGLISLYYKSRSAGIATSGIIRLANADAIAWRNAAGGGNKTLFVNSSDQLEYPAGDILLGAGFGFVTTTPDGSKTYRIFVDDNGELSTQQLT